MTTESPSLAELGSGATGDRLGFRLIVGLFWRCLPLLRPVKRHIFQLLAASAVAMTIGLPTGLIFFDVFFTRVLEGQPLTEVESHLLFLNEAGVDAPQVEGSLLTPESRKIVLRRLLWLGVPMLVFLTGLTLSLGYYQIWILQRINQNLRLAMIDRYQHLSLRYHAESQAGDAIYRLYQDSAMVTQLVDVLFIEPIRTGAGLLGAIAVISLVEPWLAIIVALFWPPALWLGAFFSHRLRIGFRRARRANSALVSRIQETLAGIRVIKACGAESREQERFEEASLHAFEEAFVVRDRLVVFQTIVFMLAGVSFIAGTGWAAWLTVEGGDIAGTILIGWLGFTVWNLGLFNWFRDQFGAATSNGRRIFDLWGRVQDIAIGLDRVFEILDSEPEIQDDVDAMELPPLECGVEFRAVHFAYQSDRPALEAVSFEARRGTVTAIVGPTGSGKSTLVSLLLRLFDPDEGSIAIDKVDLRRFQVESLRSGVSIALQENVLFSDTVRENIRYAMPGADDRAVREAARIACADGFIEKLPLGYDTILGERGAKLSTGQRQRLSIARAVIKNPAILILDEPTASLDAETEFAVLRNLVEWGRDRVTLLITHRLSTIRRVDQVLVLEEGRVVELGGPDELLKLPGGRYRSLLDAEAAVLSEKASSRNATAESEHD